MKYLYAALLTLLIPGAVLHGQPTVLFTSLATGLSSPTDVVAPPDGSNRLFITEKGGTIRIYDGNALLPGHFLDISSLVNTSSERGLLSLVFHPGYATNRFFFILYNNTAGSIVLARYRTQSGDPNTADVSSGVILLTIPHPTYDNHNGGKLNFGPDNLLYWTTGDGGGGGDPDNNAQNGGSLLGKVLRLAPDTSNTAPYYSIPAGNPYVGDPTFRDEIWAFGLRNTWRWSFDRASGDMWLADVGQGNWEEVDYVPATNVPAGGLDFGWRCREGTHVYATNTVCSTSYTDPVFEYDHSLGQCITGGYVYRGIAYPDLSGRYVCVDYLSNRLWLITHSGSNFSSTTQTAGIPSGINSFGENNAGELFAISLSGTLYSLSTPVATGIRDLLYFTHRKTEQCDYLLWKTEQQDVLSFGIEKSEDGKQFRELARVPATAGNSEYRYSLCGEPDATGHYLLHLYGSDGSDRYSQVLDIRNHATSMGIFALNGNPVHSGNSLSLHAFDAIRTLVLTDLNGRPLLEVNTLLYPGYYQFPVALPAGVYLLKALNAEGIAAVQRVMVQ